MATYYWVGGSGTWSSASSTNWSSTPTGSGGAGIPTSSDDVVFGTGTYTVTVDGSVVCKSLTASSGKTFADINSAIVTVYGSFSVVAGVIWNVITLTFAATVSGNTISAPITLNNINFNGLNGVWTLTAPLTCSIIDVQLGEFNTGNFNVTASAIISTTNPPNGQIRTITLGTSTVILIGSVPWNFTSLGGLVVNATSSVITCTAPSPEFDLAGKNYGTLNFTNGTAGTNTFNRSGSIVNLNIAPPDSPGTTYVVILGGLSVTGTLNVAGTDPTHRIAFKGGNQTSHTLSTVAWSPAVPDNLDFQFIQWLGTPTPLNLSTTNCGDLGGNLYITFRAGRTVYWNLAGTQSWVANGWALASGGTPNAAYFPLGQDNVVFNNAGAMGAVVVNDDFYVNNVDMSGRTSAATFSPNSTTKQLNVLGNWTTGTGITFTGNGGINFGTAASASISTITTNGRPFGNANYLTFVRATLADSLTVGGSVYLNYGGTSLNLNGKTLTCGAVLIGPDVLAAVIDASTTNSAIVLTGNSNVWDYGISFFANTWAANCTITCSNAIGQIFNANTSYSYPPIIQAGLGILSFTSNTASATLTSLSNTAYPTTIRFEAGVTFYVSTFSVAGQVGNFVTIDSSIPGTAATLSKSTGTVAGSYLAIKDSTATGGATWNANNSLNNGNNTGWIFTAPPAANTGGFFQLF